MEHRFVPLEFKEHPPEEMLRRAREFYEEMNRRRTVRDFSDRSVPREIIEQAILTGGTAPSGAHKQPWQFVVVEDPVYLTAPLVREQSYRQIPADTEIYPYPCEQRWPVELGPEPFHFTPHYLPGENPVLQNGRVREDTFNDQEESEINRLLDRR